MTTRSQKRKAVAELVSGDFEASLTENNSTENLIPSSSKNPRLELENLEEMKTTLRKEIMTDLTKILAENQKEMLKLIAPTSKKRSVSSNIQDSDSDQENISVTRTSTPVKTQTATSSKTTPNNSRNSILKIGKAMPFPVPHLKAVATNVPLWELLKCKYQGRFWEILQHTPAATKNVYNFHTKMCDWRFIHRARLNLCPLNGAIVWSSAPKDCRRCQSATETLNHVTNSCSTQRKNMVKRHNAVRDHLEKWLPPDVTYYKEQRFGNLQPDFVIETPAEIIIAEIKVSVEDPIAMNQTHVENQKKYEPLRNHFAQTGKRAHVTTLIFGALESVNNICKYALHRIFHNARRANSTIRHLSEIVTHHSRNQVVTHITGVPQTY